MNNIVITGGSKGMGKALVKRFAAANNNIFICARNEEALRNVSDEMQAAFPGSMVRYFATDLSTRDGVTHFADWINQRKIQVDVLINNAGNFIPGSVHNEADGALEEMIAANLYSAYHLTRALLPAMMERKSGHVFNMGSIASFQAYANGGAYSISKFALLGFSKNLREEMKPHNIKVTAVLPGAVLTPSWEGAGVPPGRIMEAEDIAEMIFCSAALSPQACVEDIVIRPLKGDLP